MQIVLISNTVIFIMSFASVLSYYDTTIRRKKTLPGESYKWILKFKLQVFSCFKRINGHNTNERSRLSHFHRGTNQHPLEILWKHEFFEILWNTYSWLVWICVKHFNFKFWQYTQDEKKWMRYWLICMKTQFFIVTFYIHTYHPLFLAFMIL